MPDIPATLSPMGDIVLMGGQQFRRKPRWYSLSLVRSATANAGFTGTIQLEPGLAPFILTSLHASDTGDGETLGAQEDWSIQMQDNEGGYLWSDGFVNRSSMFGDRIYGYPLPSPVALRANTRLTVNLQNQGTSPTAGTATITLRGWSLVPL